MNKIKALIVDDEPLARERIAGLLKDEIDIQVIAECKNGMEALKIISSEEINLMFLDIQMPEIDGFAVINGIPPNKLPQIVFTTAYDDYAIKAFEVNAIDYLLKPFDRQRFQCALNRVREKLKSGEFYSAQLLKFLQSYPDKKEFPERISVKSNDRIIFLQLNEIEWLESEANYIRIYTKGKSYQVRETMNDFLLRVNPKDFIRIHRSTAVNFNYVKELQPWSNDNYIVILKDGTKLSIGRTYRKNILTLFS
jgi:two-component system LytT family response regulator